MKRWIFVVISCCLAVLLAGSERAKGHDSILSIDPKGPVKRGVEVEFKIEVEASFMSGDEGISMVGFNVESPVKFKC